MKKIIVMSLTLLLLVSASAAETVVTSFYPIYLMAQNLLVDVPDVTLHNLAAPGTGCLHDYQLSTADMKALNKADVFLINGAGMESYLDFVISGFPSLPVVDASQGVSLMKSDSGETEWNAHIWLDVSNAITMVNNLAEGLKTALPDRADAIEANRAGYVQRLTILDGELKAALQGVARKDIITFHEAFPYFARAYGLNVAAVVTLEPEDTLSPRQLANLINTVKQLGNPPLFTEPQYESLAAQTVAQETGAPIYELDPVVTGPEENIPLTYYEDCMRANLAVLLAALSE